MLKSTAAPRRHFEPPSTILQELGKRAKFKDVFEKLEAAHKGYTFNEIACQQAFSLARKKLGFAKGPRRDKRPAMAKPTVAMAARVVPAGGAKPQTAGAPKGLVVDALTTAQKLIAACGGKEAAKHVIDNVTTKAASEWRSVRPEENEALRGPRGPKAIATACSFRASS
jgi:hypothetical protein